MYDVVATRKRFSSLSSGFAFFDAPGGSQVPDEVGEAVARTMREASGNLGAPYATGERVAVILATAKAHAGALLGASADDIVFGANATTLNFALTRAAGRDFGPGDEVVVTRLDHDANVAPWLELARDRDFTVRLVGVTDDFQLDYAELERVVTSRTRVVAFPWASNALGTRVDADRVCRVAHAVGAIAWVDAVHYAAHEPIDVEAIGADVLLCSAYKFCGPHVGIAFVRHGVAESWRPYRARPATTVPFARRFETGTPQFELLAGFTAAYRYIRSIGGMETVRDYERSLARRLCDGLPDSVTVHGPPLHARLPTFLLTVKGWSARDVALALARQKIGVWHHDHYYAVGLADRLPYPHEAVRAGIAHYNDAEEIDRFIGALAALPRRRQDPGRPSI